MANGDDDDSLPTVKNGVLSKPYPIRTKGDVNRARVLPPPAAERPAAKKPAAAAAPAATDEQPKGVLDNIIKRRNLMKSMGVRNTRVRGGARTSRA